ncbi:MAG TPA: hypothetical protein VK175_01220 [Leadbetterella sp.]|nr:hypothetical protein [Leadbetterella sp.]
MENLSSDLKKPNEDRKKFSMLSILNLGEKPSQLGNNKSRNYFEEY